jgi:alpha-D-xyloside xylohydrolase
MKILTRWMCVLVLAGCAAEAPEGSFVQDETGVVVTPASDSTRQVRLQVRTDRIVRVTSVDAKAESPKSLMVVDASSRPPAFKVEKREGEVVLETSQIAAHVSLANGAVRFTDRAGKPLLAETPHRKMEAGVSQRFNPGTDEAFYGSGQHQNAQMNLNGEDVELAQHNMDIGVPFVVSTRNYGVLWDNNGITRIGNPRPYGRLRAISRSATSAARTAASRRVIRCRADGSSSASRKTSTTTTSRTVSPGPRKCSTAIRRCRAIRQTSCRTRR